MEVGKGKEKGDACKRSTLKFLKKRKKTFYSHLPQNCLNKDIACSSLTLMMLWYKYKNTSELGGGCDVTVSSDTLLLCGAPPNPLYPVILGRSRGDPSVKHSACTGTVLPNGSIMLAFCFKFLNLRSS